MGSIRDLVDCEHSRLLKKSASSPEMIGNEVK
jgi:hypothetical protein